MIRQSSTTRAMWSSPTYTYSLSTDHGRAYRDTVDGDDLTGWDHLLQAILKNDSARFSAHGRQHGVEVLTNALLMLELREAAVLTLRYGIDPKEEPVLVRSQHDVGEQLAIAAAQVASLECSALAGLRGVLGHTVVLWEESMN